MCKFSEVVEKLAREEEPHPARLHFAQTNVDAVYTKKGSDKGERSYHSTGRNQAQNLTQATLTSSLKHKYIVRSRHATLGSEKFVPVNKFEASKAVLRPSIHIDGPDTRDTTHQESMRQVESVHGFSVFKRTSPVSQDIFRASP